MKNLILIATLLVSSLLMAQESTNQKKGVLEFETETLDYGVVVQNSDGGRNFTFTNTGNEPIVITKVKGSCGCTVATKPSKPIMPNETATIGVKYATNRIGAFSKTITVSSNAKQGNKVLRIKGTVLKPESETIAANH